MWAAVDGLTGLTRVRGDLTVSNNDALLQVKHDGEILYPLLLDKIADEIKDYL